MCSHETSLNEKPKYLEMLFSPKLINKSQSKFNVFSPFFREVEDRSHKNKTKDMHANILEEYLLKIFLLSRDSS